MRGALNPLTYGEMDFDFRSGCRAALTLSGRREAAGRP